MMCTKSNKLSDTKDGAVKHGDEQTQKVWPIIWIIFDVHITE